MTTSASSHRRIVMLAVAAVVVLAGVPQLTRGGYSTDEEFTLFAVRGIGTQGLPLLPSGLLYDRGLAYSYAGWLAGSLSGSALPAYRAVSLVSAAAALALLFGLVRRLASTDAALLAVALVAMSVPFWAAATTARFYAPFLACYLLCTRLMAPGALRVGRDFSPAMTAGAAEVAPYGGAAPRTLAPSHPRTPAPSHPRTPAPRHLRTVIALIVVAAFCRWTHELAFTLLALPVAGILLAPRAERRGWWRIAFSLGVGLAAAQAVLLAIHYLTPASGGTMVKRFFLWQVLNLFERPPAGQAGIAVVAMVIAWLVVPKRAGLALVVGLCGVSMVLSWALVRAATTAPLSLDLVWPVLAESTAYPLDMFWHIARAHPVMTGLVLALLVARLTGRGGRWRSEERAVHVAWVGWVVWFGVIESGITINYLLVPVSLMLTAIAVDVAALVQVAALPRAASSGPSALARLDPRSVAWVAALLVVVALTADQWRGDGAISARLSVARPTIDVPELAAIRARLVETDRVACTDELACLMLVGRVDAWLVLDDFVRERFVVRRGDLDVGVYAGAQAVVRPAALFDPGPDGRAPSRVLVVDVFKEYPVGNSQAWLPRAIAADGLESRTLVETPQARVVEIWPPVRNALVRRHLR